MSKSAGHLEILELTSDIVSSYAANNKIAQNELADLIKEVYAALSSLDEVGERGDAQTPAVPISKSITPDHIICLEDGKKLRMLKRHLKSAFNMSPAEYRDKWNLPADYPMVAPSYAKKRSSLAKKIGLGRKAADRKTK